MTHFIKLSELKNPEGNAGFIFNNGKGGILVFRKIVFPSFKSQRIHKNVKIAELYTLRAEKREKLLENKYSSTTKITLVF